MPEMQTTDGTIRYVPGQPLPETPDAAQVSDITLKPKTTTAQAPVSDASTLTLRGKLYYIKSCLSDNTGEAQVYLVENNLKDYVLKVYYPNFSVDKKIMKLVANMSFEMVVQLLDFGKTYIDGKPREYELMELLEGGTMDTYRVNEDMTRFRRIALQAAAAVAYCHNNGLIHKDIKPCNLFFRDKGKTQVVLADFGISSLLGPGENSIRTTQARTPIYAAPEMYTNVIDGEVEITPSVDYYSLGVTLLAIWKGSKPLNSNEREMMKMKGEGRLPGLQELPERVRMIIQGLCSVNPAARWTYNEVEKWFLGENPEVDVSSPWLKYKSFVVDPERNLIADNVRELVPMLMENESIAKGYLYGGRIVRWLEVAGNTKLSMAVKEIVQSKYPNDQDAGLVAAAYTMDPSYPYRDIHGNTCSDIRAVVLSMMRYADEYALLLRDKNNPLWLYVESHAKVNVNRMRGYFGKGSETEGRVAVTRCVYELDADLPFLPEYQSSTLQDIVAAFGSNRLEEDAWRSLCDGRLLSWMYTHADTLACESLRMLIEGQPYSKGLAYKVLYNIDKTTAYDLKNADTPEKVGEILCEQLRQWQHVSDEEFAELVSDYANPQGRFYYFAQLHGWFEVIAQADHCFDMHSAENRDRMGAYDLRTAAYRMCRILGVVPVYQLEKGLLKDGLQIAGKYRSDIRTELNHGSFAQWLAVFYHENPETDFGEEYSYERMLEKWIERLGEFDAQHIYYRRFIMARDSTRKKYDQTRRTATAAHRENVFLNVLFYLLVAAWITLLVMYGVSNPAYLLDNAYYTIGVPVGGVTAVLVASRGFFKGYGFMVLILYAILGALSSLVPVYALKFVGKMWPSALVPAMIVITLGYVLMNYLTNFRREQREDNKMVKDLLYDDVKTTLLEPLYYTFKTKSYRFKSSKSGVLDSVQDRLGAIASESKVHHLLWCLMVILVIAEMVMFHPLLLNRPNPNLKFFEVNPDSVYEQIKEEMKQ